MIQREDLMLNLSRDSHLYSRAELVVMIISSRPASHVLDDVREALSFSALCTVDAVG